MTNLEMVFPALYTFCEEKEAVLEKDYVEYAKHPSYFAEFVLRFPAFVLRVTNDRGQTLLDLRPLQTTVWIGFNYVKDFLNNTDTETPKWTAALIPEFIASYGQITDLLQDEQEKARLLDFQKQRQAEFTARLFPSLRRGEGAEG